MRSGINWANVFNNLENKKDLIQLVWSYFQTNEGRDLFETLLIINSIWSITKETIEVLTMPNHEEANISTFLINFSRKG